MCDKFKDLKIDCKNCFGLCCVALYFSKFEGFPSDKVAGKPCSHLSDDFSCKIHESLSDKGLKGCTAYDCFGAGQKVAQVTYKGIDWKQSSKTGLKSSSFSENNLMSFSLASMYSGSVSL